MAPRKKAEGSKVGQAPSKPRATRSRGARQTGTKATRADGRAVAAELLPAEPRETLAEPEAELDADVVTEVDAESAERSAEEPKRPRGKAKQARGESLVVRDPLQAYMAEVHKHPLLTREEEHALAVRFKETGDVKAAYRLVAANLRLVVKLAHEYHRNPLSLLDLVQEGNIGLMQAVRKYDPYRGVKLSSYAAWWIRAYILRYIMDNWKMVKLGTTEAQRKLFFKLRQEQERLLAQGVEVTPKLLADRLQVSEQDVVEMDQRLGRDEVSLDAPMGEEGAPARVDRMLPSPAAGADERLGNEQLRALFKEKLAEFAKSLEEKERYIFERRLVADEPLTLQEIGARYGVSRERARQIEAALLQRMRDYMREQMPDFDLTRP